jgi:hypothetical protein
MCYVSLLLGELGLDKILSILTSARSVSLFRTLRDDVSLYKGIWSSYSLRSDFLR